MADNRGRIIEIDACRRATAPPHPVAGRRARQRSHLAALLLAPHVRLRRPGLPGERRLHGPRQLGHGSRRRRPFRLPASLGAGALERHGHSAANPERAPGHRHRPRPRPGVPGALSARREHCALDPLRNRHRRVRPGGSAWRRHRPQPAVPYPAAAGRAAHRRRYAAPALVSKLRHPHASRPSCSL